jgi:hypothetical protein
MNKINKIIELYNGGYNLTVIEKMVRSDHRTIKSVLENNNIKLRSLSEINRKYSVDENYFNNIDSADKAYWLGFIITDGNVRESGAITIVLKDEEHLYKFKKCTKSEHPVRYIKKRNIFNISIGSNIMKQDLKKYGVVPNKTHICCPPAISEYEKDFWRGCVDGDGWVSFYSSQDIYCVGLCGTREMVQGFIDFISKNTDIKPKTPSKRKTICEVKYSGSKARKIVSLLYDGANIYLDRKMSVVMNILK